MVPLKDKDVKDEKKDGKDSDKGDKAKLLPSDKEGKRDSAHPRGMSVDKPGEKARGMSMDNKDKSSASADKEVKRDSASVAHARVGSTDKQLHARVASSDKVPSSSPTSANSTDSKGGTQNLIRFEVCPFHDCSFLRVSDNKADGTKVTPALHTRKESTQNKREQLHLRKASDKVRSLLRSSRSWLRSAEVPGFLTAFLAFLACRCRFPRHRQQKLTIRLQFFPVRRKLTVRRRSGKLPNAARKTTSVRRVSLPSSLHLLLCVGRRSQVDCCCLSAGREQESFAQQGPDARFVASFPTSFSFFSFAERIN